MPLRLSVIVPARNATRFLPRCLDALNAARDTLHEILVVDDASDDGTAELARGRGVRVIRMDRQAGPAAARNRAARIAKGDVLLFVDCDVLVTSAALRGMVRRLEADPGLTAIFGSYDDAPPEPNFFSQYKNLFHHYVHQRSSGCATTFWSGFGAVRRTTFLEAGGFDTDRFPQPSIEDIDLGRRLTAAGHRVELDADLQVTHLKRWTLYSVVKTDIVHRAIPWSRLILETGRMDRDLNLSPAHRLSALFTCLALALALAGPIVAPAVPAAALLLGWVLFLNRGLYGFFRDRRGTTFALRAIPAHLLYYVYSTLTFGTYALLHKVLPESPS